MRITFDIYMQKKYFTVIKVIAKRKWFVTKSSCKVLKYIKPTYTFLT